MLINHILFTIFLTNKSVRIAGSNPNNKAISTNVSSNFSIPYVPK